MDVVGQVVVFIGSLFVLLAAVGTLRFDEVLSRMHALCKATTLGVVLVLGGAALTMSNPNDWTSLLLALILIQLFLLRSSVEKLIEISSAKSSLPGPK